jgi:hypothetical protein
VSWHLAGLRVKVLCEIEVYVPVRMTKFWVIVPCRLVGRWPTFRRNTVFIFKVEILL